MDSLLKFKIDGKFRDPIDIASKDSKFIGRNQEIKRLQYIIGNRNSATVLISGMRGIGKTSFVREVIRRGTDKQLLPIEISCANLFPEQDNIKSNVLKSLIRNLYFTVSKLDIGESLKKEVSELYDKTFLTELKESNVAELVASTQAQVTSKNVQEVTTKIELDPSLKNVLLVSLSTVLTGIMAYPVYSAHIDWYWKFGGVILILLGSFALISKVSIRNTKEQEASITEGVVEKNNISKSAKLDLSDDTLEIGLKSILEGLKERKIVFILDELDKIEVEEQDNHPIYQIIKLLKNLFTLSNAIYIFITDDTFYYDFQERLGKNKYSSISTLFTDKIFLTVHYSDEVAGIIDKLAIGEISNTQLFEKFRLFVSWEASNHIFNVHNILDRFTYYDESGEPYIALKKPSTSEKGNLPDNWEIVGNMQKFLSVIYKRHLYDMDFSINEKLYLTLRQITKILMDDWEIKVIDDNYLGILHEDMVTQLQIPNDEKLRLDFSGAIEDLLKTIERTEYAISNEIEKKAEPAVETSPSMNIVTYELTQGKEPAIEEMEHFKILSYEQVFVDSVNSFENKLNLVKQAQLPINTNYQKILNKHNRLILPIKNEEAKNRLRKSAIESATRDIQNTEKELIEETKSLLISKYSSRELNPIGQYSADHIKATFPILAKFVDTFTITGNDLTSLGIPASNNYVCFGFNITQEQYNEYMKIPHKDRVALNVYIINILITDDCKKLNIFRGQKWTDLCMKKDLSNIHEVNRFISGLVRDRLS